MKKMTAFCLALGMMASLLAGCSQGGCVQQREYLRRDGVHRHRRGKHRCHHLHRAEHRVQRHP